MEGEMLDLESLYSLSYAMCIVTSVKEGAHSGCTVNTVCQIAPEPPMVIVSINRKSLTCEYITAGGVFAASILSESAPISLIARFGFRSCRDFDKFESVNYKTGQTGSRIILDNTVAYLEAKVVESFDVHTHRLFIAEIVACRSLDTDKPTMTYSYYRDIKHGRTPKSAATFLNLSQKQSEREKGMKKYKCLLCGYIYDPAVGDPENGVQPGIAFEDLPDDWICPECGAGKDEFEAIDD